MAINKNHEFEELDGIKCGIVEKNVSPERVAFLKKILEYNKFTVVVVPSPPPKAAAAPVIKVAEPNPDEPLKEDPAAPTSAEATVDKPQTFTVGVSDYTFNTINAIFGRLLKAPGGHVVTMAYWNQQEKLSDDEVPYYEKRNGA